MCQKHSTVLARVGGKAFRVDPCIRNEIEALNQAGVKTLACCCGHGVYPKTIVFKGVKGPTLFHSGVQVPRKRRFYVRDGNGVFHIPETPLWRNE